MNDFGLNHHNLVSDVLFRSLEVAGWIVGYFVVAGGSGGSRARSCSSMESISPAKCSYKMKYIFSSRQLQRTNDKCSGWFHMILPGNYTYCIFAFDVVAYIQGVKLFMMSEVLCALF